MLYSQRIARNPDNTCMCHGVRKFSIRERDSDPSWSRSKDDWRVCFLNATVIDDPSGIHVLIKGRFLQPIERRFTNPQQLQRITRQHVF
jgi:hypothetical protein